MGASRDATRYKYTIIGFVAAAFFLFYFVYNRQGTALGHKVRYGLMFDAGSTGSRVHVFSFDARTGRLLDEIFQEVKPGLSSYASDPQAAARSLQPLMDTSVKAVPINQHSTTPIALKATAGLRQLGKEKADEILQAVRDYFATFNFKMADDAVQIMEGSDEGVYAWITVNYLLNRLGSERKSTVSIMDLGGASTQIVFEPKGEAMKAAPAEYVYKLQFGKFEYILYQHSYDRYGLMRAREKILAKAIEGKHVCIPRGYTHKQKIDSKDLSFLHHDTVSFNSCYNTVKHIIDKTLQCSHQPCSFGGAFQPDITNPLVFSDDMYAFSYFFDRTQLDGERPTITLGEVRQMAQASCALEGPDEAHGAQCMDLTYIYALLHDGYNLQDSHKLNIAKKINGIETAWALGAMVVQLAQMDAQTAQTA